MKLIYKHIAVMDMQQMKFYIEETLKNKTAANKFLLRLLQDISSLKKNPYLGVSVAEKFSVTSTMRILVSNKQLVFYELTDAETITIIRILDSRQNYLAVLLAS